MQKFVENVRGISSKNLERDILDEEIDQAFLDTFKGYEGFSDFAEKYR